MAFPTSFQKISGKFFHRVILMWNELIHSTINFGIKLYFGTDNQLKFFSKSIKNLITLFISACMLGCFNQVRLCDYMNYNPPGSSVHGILQARKLEWVAMPTSRGSSPPRDRSLISPALQEGFFFFFFTTSTTWEVTLILKENEMCFALGKHPL